LNRIEDRNGNIATIDYRGIYHPPNYHSNWAAEKLPAAVHYAPNREIRFYYEKRPDTIDSFQGGVHTQTTMRINRITMSGPELLRDYRLSYQSNSTTGRSLLHSVTECDHDGTCLRPLEFRWSLGSYGFDVIDTNITDAGAEFLKSGKRIIAGDISGDGRDDILY